VSREAHTAGDKGRPRFRLPAFFESGVAKLGGPDRALLTSLTMSPATVIHRHLARSRITVRSRNLVADALADCSRCWAGGGLYRWPRPHEPKRMTTGPAGPEHGANAVIAMRYESNEIK
jgi:uncharacterized protein YbjQ (UPF0145 family)